MAASTAGMYAALPSCSLNRFFQSLNPCYIYSNEARAGFHASHLPSVSLTVSCPWQNHTQTPRTAKPWAAPRASQCPLALYVVGSSQLSNAYALPMSGRSRIQSLDVAAFSYTCA
jgi:hypothetical protein